MSAGSISPASATKSPCRNVARSERWRRSISWRPTATLAVAASTLVTADGARRQQLEADDADSRPDIEHGRVRCAGHLDGVEQAAGGAPGAGAAVLGELAARCLGVEGRVVVWLAAGLRHRCIMLGRGEHDEPREELVLAGQDDWMGVSQVPASCAPMAAGAGAACASVAQ